MGCKEKSHRGRKLRHAPVTAGKLTAPCPNSNPNPIPSDYCTEEELEELLLKSLDRVYSQALSRLVSLNYDEPLALRALLRNGHCYGPMDAFSNVVHNAVAFLSSGDTSSAASGVAFSDLRHLQEYSLAGMVCLLQQVRPSLTRGDAMWCLLASDLNVGRAAALEIPSRYDPGPPASRPEVSDVVDSVLKSLENMSIKEEREGEGEGEEEEEEGKEMILDLVKQIRDLEAQVKEQKEWAQRKAVQAAKKLSNDLTELKVLRMEREENQRVKLGKQALEDSTMRRLAEMEGALKKASGHVDRANAAVHRLETENAEIWAEMEACKLSASESAAACLEVAKKERRYLKKLLAWEKQRDRLQGEITEEREKIGRIQRQLEEVHLAQKEAEVKWRREIKAKEQAIAQVEEERGAKEVVGANIKRTHEELRRKIEIDFQRHKDDIHRLEEELSRLKVSAGSTQLNNSSEVSKPAKETNTKPVQMVNRNRVCLICMKEEVSVVFLPCAHQVVCTSCNEDHETKTCPCCNRHIAQRICVYGASS